VTAPYHAADQDRGVDTPRAPDAATAPVAALSTEREPKGRDFYRRATELIAQAADALEHAHSLGIVHRDVKPGNLLLDDAGKVWVTDFGLARIDAGANLTMTGDLLGTLRYMAPEQALAKHNLVDHRADVYALGATLYELLTLRPAVGGEDKQEVLRRIAFEDLVPPRKLDRAIPAELETIALKCLAKEPKERYATAGELAADLRRWMGDHAIKATPSLRQKAAKWARRHRAVAWSAAAVALLAVAALGVIAGLVGYQNRRLADKNGELIAANAAERQARADADAERARADENYRQARAAVRRMLTRVATGEIGVVPEMQETRRRLLEDAAAIYQELFQGNSLVADALVDRAGVLDTLGRHDETIADYRQALERTPDNARLHRFFEGALRLHDPVEALVHAQRAVELDPQRLEYRVRLVEVYTLLGRTEDARAALDAALRLTPVRSPETARLLRNAYVALNDFAGALPHARTVVELAPDQGASHWELGAVYAQLGEDDKALAEFGEGIRLIRPHDSGNIYPFQQRGDLYMKRQQYASALADYDRAIEVGPAYSHLYKRPALAHFRLGNYPAALADIARAVHLNPDDSNNVTWIPPGEVAACPDAAFRSGVIDQATRALVMTNGSPGVYAARAQIYSAMEDDANAADDLAKALAGYRRRLDELTGKPGHEAALTVLAAAQVTRGSTMLQRRRYADAESVLKECLDTPGRLTPDFRRFNAMSFLGGAYLGQKKYAEAEPLLLQGYEGMRQWKAQYPVPWNQIRLAEAAERVAELYEATNRPEEAREWRQKLPMNPPRRGRSN
jgi:tetratricopeptide (TPR) repeat protein